MDENNNNLDKQASEKQHTEQNTKKALQAVEKGAATYFAGPEGAAAVNALHSAPVVGKALNKVEDKAVEKLGKNKNVANIANKLGDSGITDAANQGLDAVGAAGGATGGAVGAAGGAASKAGNATGAANATSGASSSATSASKAINDKFDKMPRFLKGSNNDNESSGQEGGGEEISPSERTARDVKKAAKIIKMIGPFIPYIAGIIVTVLVIVMVMAEIMVIRDKIVGAIVGVIKFEQKLQNFVTGDGWNTEDEAFFLRLKEAYINFNESSNETLDIPLIAATIHYSKITDMNNWDGEEDEHASDIGEGQQNYSDSQDAGIGSSIVETFQTWSFYQVANVKLGSSLTLIPGQRGLLGHLIKTDIEWRSVCILDAPGYWLNFFEDIFNITTLNEAIEMNNGSVGAGLLQKISDFLGLGLGMITALPNLISDIAAFAAQDASLLDWWSANVIYEARELVEFFTKDYDDSRLVEASYSYYNNLSGTGTKSEVLIEGYNDYQSNQDKPAKDSEDKCIINVPVPEVVRTMDYKSYYRYLVNVYIPVTYYRGLTLDVDYTFLEVVNIANDIFDQKYLYDYLVGEDEENANSGCDYNFSGSSSEKVSVDKNMIDNLYVNVMSGSCSSVNSCNLVEETVSLRDYVMGVVYREIGASTSDNAEYLKANIIAAKSFTVGRRTATQNGDKYYINMLNSTNDQVYCSVTKGCLNASSNSKPAPSSSLLEYLGKLYDEVYNEFLYNSSGSTFTGYYRAKESQCIGANLAGSCLGQTDSRTMADTGKDYQAILGHFYVNPIGLVDISTGNFSVGVMQCISSGLKLGTDGYYIRTTEPESTNIYFNSPYVSDSNRGQCVWYVKGRAQEIIANSIADTSKKETAKDAITGMNGNGNQWYAEQLTKVFGSSQDYKLPKAGAIAVYDWTDAECLSYWQRRGQSTCVTKYGHSLIVESVEGDNVSISQGWTSCSTGSPAWNCVEFSYSTHPVSYMKDLGGGYKFIGYIYLLN